jgi:hypothetical protein
VLGGATRPRLTGGRDLACGPLVIPVRNGAARAREPRALIDAAVAARAATLRPVTKSLWGYGGVVQAPDGTIWQVASSSKKDIGPATRQIDEIVLPLGVAEVAASKRFSLGRGLTVAKGFGSKYVEFATGAGSVKPALYKRRALAKVAGVSPDGTGSHRLTVVAGAGMFSDPDGFAWAAASQTAAL